MRLQMYLVCALRAFFSRTPICRYITREYKVFFLFTFYLFLVHRLLRERLLASDYIYMCNNNRFKYYMLILVLV